MLYRNFRTLLFVVGCVQWQWSGVIWIDLHRCVRLQAVRRICGRCRSIRLFVVACRLCLPCLLNAVGCQLQTPFSCSLLHIPRAQLCSALAKHNTRWSYPSMFRRCSWKQENASLCPSFLASSSCSVIFRQVQTYVAFLHVCLLQTVAFYQKMYYISRSI